MAKEVQTISVVVTNTSRNPRGVNAANGKTVMLSPGQASAPIDVTAGELVSLRMGGEFAVEEIGPGQPVIRRELEPVRVTGDAALRKQLADKDAEIVALTATVAELKSSVADLTRQLADKDADAKPAVADVLTMANADGVHFKTFEAEAKKLLGDKTPGTKAEIIAALEELATRPS